MRARVGILVLLTIAALAVFEAVSPPDQRLLFPSPASEPASAEPVLREMPADVPLLPVDDSTESLNLIGPALQPEAMPGSSLYDPWFDGSLLPRGDIRMHGA